MKKLLIMALAVMLTGCETVTDSNYERVASGRLYDIYCIRDVQYIVVDRPRASTITPLLRPDGNITTCEPEYLEDLAFHEYDK